MLSLDDFSPISLEDKPLFDAHYSRYPPSHSDEMFTTMCSWMSYTSYHYTFVDKALLIYGQHKDTTFFRTPHGTAPKHLFEELFALARKEGEDPPVYILGESNLKAITAQYPTLHLNEHRNYFDYVYRTADLASLQGSAYSKIRNRLNKFTKHVEYFIEPITPDNMEQVHIFLKRWCLWKDCDSDEILAHEKQAILYSMDHFFDLGLSGLLLRINGRIEALAVYEQLNEHTAVVHYEKGSPYFDGIYKAINKETARLLEPQYTYINREEDMGIAGLRKAKMSYRPHHMSKVYIISKKDLP